jgi:hypothetical protein
VTGVQTCALPISEDRFCADIYAVGHLDFSWSLVNVVERNKILWGWR